MGTFLLEDFTPTYEALSIIYESLESDSETFKSMVTTGYLMESGASKDIVMESVSDIFKTIADGIKKFIENVKKFFKKILLYITSAYQDLDKVAAEVKKVIDGKNDIEFTIDGYKFTVIDKSSPNISEFQNIVAKYNDDMTKISDLKEKEVKDEVMEWLTETNLDRLRGQVLGINQSIPDTEYLDEIRKYYRNGEDSTQSITVNRSMVDSIISNAKKLEDAKKASIKDRDNLINLLSKSETFFGRTIQTFYKGNTKQINVNKVNIDNNKFSTEDNKINVNDDMSKMISTYASYKAKQVNKIAGMINLVACERVNALKDQIKQERTILRKCLFGNTKDEKKDNVSESIGIDGKDYSIIAMESCIRDYNIYEQTARQALFEETDFMLNALSTGKVSSLLEADTEKLGGKIKQAISDIIEMVVGNFRKKAIGTDEFNNAWMDDITKPENKLEEKAKAKKEFTMTDFFSAEYKKNISDLTSAIKTAYDNTNYNDVSWASTILPSINSPEILRDTNTRTKILNYYRTGKGEDKFETKKMSGSELAGKLKEMESYIRNYGTTITKPTENISKAFKTASDGFKVMESWSPSSYLEILGCTVSESDAILCRDYDSVFGVMEADENKPKIGNGTDGIGDANRATRNAANAVSNETQNGKETAKSATTTNSVDDEKKKEELGLKQEKTNSDANAYKRMVDNFFKNCITLYLKAREEQYIAFSNALSDIDGARPKKDKNGKYIPKAEANNNQTDNNDKEVVKTETK